MAKIYWDLASFALLPPRTLIQFLDPKDGWLTRLAKYFKYGINMVNLACLFRHELMESGYRTRMPGPVIITAYQIKFAHSLLEIRLLSRRVHQNVIHILRH